MKVLAAVTVGLALALAARTGLAQEISIANESSLPRVDAAGNQLAKRSLTLDPEVVSNQDCLDDQRIRFATTLTDYVANATVQAWASSSGQDCASATNRTGQTALCWRLVDGNIPLVPQQNVDIPVRRLMSGALTPVTPDATASICGQVPLTAITVSFLYFAPGNISVAAFEHTLPVTVDTVDAPGTISQPGSTTTANGVGCSTTRAGTSATMAAVFGIAALGLVRRRRR